MNTKNILVAAALLATTNAWAVDGSITLEGVSDYRFRGISQSAGDPAIQASFDLAFDSGFYAGVWGSNIDFEDEANYEIDWYGGYFWEINDAVGLDIMLSYYTYPDADYDADYLELVNSLYVGDFMFQYAYSNDYVNTGEAGHYLAADYSWPFAETAGPFEGLSLDLHYGYSFGDFWEDLDIGTYSDYSIGLSASWKVVDMSLSYLNTSTDSGMQISSGAFENDDTVLFTIGSTFDLF